MDRFNTFKLFIQEHKNKIIIISLFIAIISLSTWFFLNIDRSVKTKTESLVFLNQNIEDEEETTIECDNSYIYVDIKGEVNSPGVYSIESGKRVVDAINLAGGLKENSDTTLLNLSIKLTDQMVIIVYPKNNNLNDINSLKQEFEDNSKICKEEIINDACIINNPETVLVPDLIEKNDIVVNNNSDNLSKININTASLETLKTLPKIGDVKANSIITYRETNGSFKSIDEIKNVKGIGDTLFESIKEYITV